MEVTINLPDKIFANVSQLAETKKKSVAQIIKKAVQKALTEEYYNFEEQVEIIRQSITLCSDKEVLELANLQMPDDERLSYLFEKNRESGLTARENMELTKAVELSRINDLRKAFGIIEAQKRGLI